MFVHDSVRRVGGVMKTYDYDIEYLIIYVYYMSITKDKVNAELIV